MYKKLCGGIASPQARADCVVRVRRFAEDGTFGVQDLGVQEHLGKIRHCTPKTGNPRQTKCRSDFCDLRFMELRCAALWHAKSLKNGLSFNRQFANKHLG